ncbi:hypothetical protein [Azohydromonas aeria]|uniref:hypothetical protein n=1 Tax=Azohydromonas aeria TaxID=2590212 RepID=UPI0012F7859C|nr:hypothetical protein [Azohydromonas aeria]
MKASVPESAGTWFYRRQLHFHGSLNSSFAFGSFLCPVNEAPMANLIQAGAAVPVQ